jgi:hypothetical protein
MESRYASPVPLGKAREPKGREPKENTFWLFERKRGSTTNPARLLLILCFSGLGTGVDAHLEPPTNVTAPKIEDLEDPSLRLAVISS